MAQESTGLRPTTGRSSPGEPSSRARPTDDHPSAPAPPDATAGTAAPAPSGATPAAATPATARDSATPAHPTDQVDDTDAHGLVAGARQDTAGPEEAAERGRRPASREPGHDQAGEGVHDASGGAGRTRPVKGRGGAPESRRMTLARAAAAMAGGALLFLAFPPTDWWACAPLGIGLVVAALHGTRPRRAAWLGYLAAVVFLLPALAWVRTIGDDVWVMLVGVSSVFYAVMAALAAPVFRLKWWPVWFGGLWVAMEWARGLVPVGGFPWARVAFSQGESLFTRYAALGGAPLVSFVVALCGALLAYAALTRRGSPRRAPHGTERATGPRAAGTGPQATGAGLRVAGTGPQATGTGPGSRRWAPAGAVGLALAVPLLSLAVPRPGDEGRTVNIGIVQGNVPGEGMYVLGDEPAVVLKNHANETKRLAQAVREGRLPRPDLVVLPENSTDIDPYRDPYARQVIDDSVKDVGVPTLVGAVVAIGDEHRATRSLVWDPATGPGAYYDKQHLVPFGEYTPFKEIVLALWERANLVGRQSVAGTRPGDLRMGPVTVGAVNCYEVAYDGTVRGTVRTGATPIVVQTNNASYALSNLPPQQLAMSKLRAVEHNRAVVTAATTGISAYVTPDGKVSWRTRERVADMTVVTVPVRTQATIATRVGALPEWALALMGVAAAGVAMWGARRRGDRMGRD
ncbi:apolipoprotein N-acyltransferase [Nonomuraea muscovyensis]|uniref:Apolipoprotein N-acyltransferase n=1 Tax=Nonomuraea muscovyensis TaxID=1124761 RepID=A0A7X0C7S3_9ACTN|nr:apolipoprotein N-acyltransferase [Nonomuraea muscovyensis]MBB6348299.1 apolipoprotein N-acyltransferase [Nonomuraea muscovyensis]